MTRDELIVSNLGLVGVIAKKFRAKAWYQLLDYDDIRSMGMIGLVKAADCFKPERGVEFATFASRCITNEILVYFRKPRPKTVSLHTPIAIDGEGNELTIEDVFPEEEDFSSAVVDEFLSRLKPRERDVIALRLSGQTHADIAEKMGVTGPSITRFLQRIHRKYRYLLDEEVVHHANS